MLGRSRVALAQIYLHTFPITYIFYVLRLDDMSGNDDIADDTINGDETTEDSDQDDEDQDVSSRCCGGVYPPSTFEVDARHETVIQVHTATLIKMRLCEAALYFEPVMNTNCRSLAPPPT